MTLHPAIEILQNLHLTQELHERWEARTVAGYHFVVSKSAAHATPIKSVWDIVCGRILAMSAY